ncbi:beta-1,3-galactosyltransferase 4-like [Ahaetulla prasina]|uniref:beta-1,3-galactosyltransferase 4-like n=1 Tax=Ahaetulla prasina TaxID=499056 RepID=UPI002649B456|nr:beta-1,3-galactosyltransferase 4-like [Ahaetulla prasina]XP_058028297.1 beta-1,3-galactosyltransferase 4-like [Ahaetulla prasina]
MPPFPKRCLRCLAWLLGFLAILLALTFLVGGRHEELLSRLLPLLLWVCGVGEPHTANSHPLLPTTAFFLLSPPACDLPATTPGLLVLVASAPGHAAQRVAVRQSWGMVQEAGGLAVRTIFVLGLPGEVALQAALEHEATKHGDLLQGHFADTYANLTLKTLTLLGWAATHCPATRFLLKADDDVFLNLPALASHLRTLEGPDAAYLGHVHWLAVAIRDPHSRHYVPASLYPSPIFPPYCSGPAYVLSGSAATAVLAAARHLPLLPVEDAFVGLCARHAGIAPRHLAHMARSTRYPPDACCYREVLFSIHGVAPVQMLAMWAEPERPCSTWQRLLGLARCKVLTWLTASEEQ